MADITQAEQDLADAVSAVAGRVLTDISALKAQIASGNTVALQATADKIETAVAALSNVDPASQPPVTPAA